MPGRLRTGSRPSRTCDVLGAVRFCGLGHDAGSPLDGWVETVMRSPHAAATRTGCRDLRSGAVGAPRPGTAPVAVTRRASRWGRSYQRSALFSAHSRTGSRRLSGTHPDLDGGRRRRRPARPASRATSVGLEEPQLGRPRGSVDGDGERAVRRAARGRLLARHVGAHELGPALHQRGVHVGRRAAEMPHQTVRGCRRRAPARGLGFAGSGSHGMGRVHGPPATAGPPRRHAA